MRTISLPVERLARLLKNRKIATLNELKKELGTKSSMTIFRKLKQLDYLSSCSHSGKYYTLRRLVRFNNIGVWFHKSVLFSSYGTYEETLSSIVEQSQSGYSASELESLLKMKPNAALHKLFQCGRVRRGKIGGIYIYFSQNKTESAFQEAQRRELWNEQKQMEISPDILMNELKAGIIIFYSTLNEKQRRLYSGLESLKLGRNGDRIISELLNINIKTVGKGRRELLEGAVDIDTIREPGGGRKKKRDGNS